MKKLTKVIIVLDVLVAICFFLVYGPIEYIKNTIISTAMVTKTHQYIAYTFYSKNMVNKVLQKDSYIPFDEDVDLDKIVIDTSPKESYDNEYDEIILTRDEGNDDFKLIELEVGGYKAFLVAIYDPSKVRLSTSPSFNNNKKGAERVKDTCKRLGGLVCINGGAFKDPDGWGSDIPQGYLIKDGEIIWSDDNDRANLIGFTKDNKLLLTAATGEEAIAMGMRDALEFGPFLIVNGEQIKFEDAAGGYNRAARVAIGQRKDGVVLFLVTEGVHANGPKLIDLAETLAKYGAYNAANLDGGSSAQLVINNQLVNNPLNVAGQPIKNGRKVVSGFIVMP